MTSLVCTSCGVTVVPSPEAATNVCAECGNQVVETSTTPPALPIANENDAGAQENEGDTSSKIEPRRKVPGRIPRPPGRSARDAAKRYIVGERRNNVARAGKYILWVSIGFLVFGTIFGLMTKSNADKARSELSILDPKLEVVHPISKNAVTVADLLEEIDTEVRFVFITNYVLSVIMLGLYFWGRKKPLPAMITAVAVYGVVILINAISDPKTIVQGALLKILFFMAMFAGIKACLSQEAEKRASAR